MPVSNSSIMRHHAAKVLKIDEKRIFLPIISLMFAVLLALFFTYSLASPCPFHTANGTAWFSDSQAVDQPASCGWYKDDTCCVASTVFSVGTLEVRSFDVYLLRHRRMPRMSVKIG